MKNSWLRIGWFFVFVLSIDSVSADLFTGKFTGMLDGEKCQLSISGSARGQYEGVLQIGTDTAPLNARRFGDRIAGQIGIAEYSYGFMVQMEGDVLMFRAENGNVVVFKRN